MSTISSELERVMHDVGDSASEPYRNLRAVIESSPVLMERMNTAAQQGHLQHLAWMSENENAGASYLSSTRTIHLKQHDLLDPKQHDKLAFLLGHEMQHGLNREQVRQGLEQFSRDMMQVLQNGQPAHDYSPAMARMLAINRTDEASAHIAGWNALASRVRHNDPDATLQTVAEAARRAGYVNDFAESRTVNGQEQFTIRPGLTFNPDLSIPPEARNIEAAAAHFFDKAPGQTRIGRHGNSDYTNYYAAGLIGQLCQTEMINPTHAGQLTLDMKRLKLQESLLEQNGIPLAAPSARCAYIDAGSPRTVRHFDHTIDSRHVPIDGLPRPVALPVYDPSDPAHGHHALYAALKECIPYASNDRLAQFTAACHVKGITGDNLLRAIPMEAANQVWFERSWPPGPFAKIDLTAPMPTQQQMHEQVQDYDQQQAIGQARLQTRQARIDHWS